MSFSFDLNDSLMSFNPPTYPDGCTQCGMCLYTCPTFIKSEDPEQSPMGRIRLMRALENGNNEGMAVEKLESCLGCYSCESVCPSNVNFGRLLDQSLVQLHEQKPIARITRIMLWLTCRIALIKHIMQVTYITQITGLRTLFSKLGLFKLMGLKRAEALLGKVNYPTKLKKHIQQTVTNKRVALFTGCFSSVMEQAIHQSTIDVFNALDIEVDVPSGQRCCGALHRHNGELETAERLARINIKAFPSNTDAIISCSSGCGASLKKYGEWLEGEELPIAVMDVSHYLASVLKHHKINIYQLPLKVALHTPCTLRQVEDQEQAVTELLQMIPGLEIMPLSGEPRCCGAGGSHILSQPQMADVLLDDIIDEIKKMEADVLISSNLGCAMHLKKGLAQAGINIPLQHPVQLIAQAIAEEK